MVASLGVEAAALILGILAWRSHFAKAAVVVVVLLPLLSYALFVARQPASPVFLPTISVEATYPGASAEVVRDTIAAPIEQQVNGVEGMLHLWSRSTNKGTYLLQITFRPGVDLDVVRSLVQSRVNLALPMLPDAINRSGIKVRKEPGWEIGTRAAGGPAIDYAVCGDEPDKVRELAEKFSDRLRESKKLTNLRAHSGVLDRYDMYPMVEFTADPAAGVSAAEARDVCREALIEARVNLHLAGAYRGEWLDMPHPRGGTAAERRVTFRDAAPQPNGNKAADNVEKKAVFGPVIERSVNDWRKNPTDSGIDLDSGELFSMPNDILPKRGHDLESNEDLRIAWARARGIDAVGYVGMVATITRNDAKPVKTVVAGLVAEEMATAVADNSEWDRLTAAEVQAEWAKHQRQSRGAPHGRAPSIAVDFPATKVFRTREGGMGILQILGFTGSSEKPIGVKIRYKLVQTSATTTTAAENTAARLKLESAQRAYELVCSKYLNGQTTRDHVLRAGLARDLAKAELRGDPLKTAHVKAEYTRAAFDLIEAQYKNGQVPAEEVEKARLARDLAPLELKKLMELKATRQRTIESWQQPDYATTPSTGSEPAKPAVAESDAKDARRKVEAAEGVLKIIEAKYKVGAATSKEFFKAELDRDLAAAELHANAVEAARARLHNAEQRLEFYGVRVKVGYGASQLELEQAKLARDSALAELQKLEAATATKAEPGNAAAESVAEIARRKLEAAERQFQLAEIRFNDGQTTVLEVLKAGLVRELAKAELHGSLLEAANAKAQYTKKIFDVLQTQYRQGTVSAEVVTQAKLDRDLAEMDLRHLAGAEPMKLLLSAQAQSEAGKAAAKKAAPSEPAAKEEPQKPRKWQGIVLTYEAEPGAARPGAGKQQLAESFRASRQELTDLIRAVDRRVNSGPEKTARVYGNSTPLGVQIVVELFNRDDAVRQRVERLLLHPGKLEFRVLANTHDNKDLIERAMKEPKKAEVLDPAGKRLAWWAPVKAGEERVFASYSDIARRTREKDDEEITEVLVLADPYNVTGKYLAQAKAGVDPAGKPCVAFSLNAAGGKRLAKLTGEHLPDKSGKYTWKLGVILDGQLQSAPAIQSVISDHGQISGIFSKQDVADLADILNAGSLPMRLRLVNP
ncbi:MAG: efflux RND transporter permease subunit [Thermoguttaceae bacterium]